MPGALRVPSPSQHRPKESEGGAQAFATAGRRAEACGPSSCSEDPDSDAGQGAGRQGSRSQSLPGTLGT